LGTRSSLSACVLMIDPKKHKVARTCQRVWAQGLKDLSEQLNQYFPNDEERAEFGEDVENNILNSDFHLYCLLYSYTDMSLTSRYVVTGRKPDIKE
jgi:hypothetical protein